MAAGTERAMEPSESSSWSSWIGSASAGAVGMVLAGPAGGVLGVANSVLVGEHASNWQAHSVATGLVVVCALGGHVLLAGAGVAGCGISAAQHYWQETKPEAVPEAKPETSAETESETEEEPPERQAEDSCWPCFAGWRKKPVVVESLGKLEKRSERNLRRHFSGSDFLLYETTSQTRRHGELKPTAHVELNHCLRMENEHFEGSLLMMHRPTPGASSPFAGYFSQRTRRWELRLQGRFRKKPSGKLYLGVVLRDFDYSQPLSYFTSWLSTLSIAPLEYLLGSKVLLSFGDRQEDSLKDDAMCAQVVSGMQAFDRIIVSSEAPPLEGDLDNQGITRRGAESAVAWAAAVEEIEASIDCEKVYTFCFWSASRNLDLMGGALTDLLPLVPAIPLSSFLDQWPPHFVFYVLEGETKEEQVKQLEKNKSYLLDVMMLAKDQPQQHIATTYYFAA